MKEWHDSGNWVPWNKGLTIEDERVKNNVEKNRAFMNTEEVKKKCSEQMKILWKEGKITKLEGIKSSRWKGRNVYVNSTAA